MKLRGPLILGGLLAAALAAWFLRTPAEPVYHGHPISYWIEPWQHHGAEPQTNIAAAFSQMDERAVRWLAAQLDWRPSELKRSLNDMVARLISAKFFSDAPDRREVAGMALGRLGPRAVRAVPALERLVRDAAEPRAGNAKAAAMAALILIRGDSPDAYLDKLRNPASPDWVTYATVFWHLGTNGAPAVPHLVKTLADSPPEHVLPTAACTLGMIRSRPELSVPALSRMLEHTNHQVRWHAVLGLGQFGPQAKPGWPALVRRLADSDRIVRFATTNALKQIDPDGARQLGVN